MQEKMRTIPKELRSVRLAKVCAKVQILGFHMIHGGGGLLTYLFRIKNKVIFRSFLLKISCQSVFSWAFSKPKSLRTTQLYSDGF